MSANDASALETFLQARLADDPVFAARSLHILPTPDGELRVEVDGEFYAAVQDVPELDARAFLTRILTEWNAQQGLT